MFIVRGPPPGVRGRWSALRTLPKAASQSTPAFAPSSGRRQGGIIPAMRHRPLGDTHFKVSEIGLGCWQLSGSDWGDLPDDRAFDILRSAADAGVNFFDTADVYGTGRSET